MAQPTRKFSPLPLILWGVAGAMIGFWLLWLLHNGGDKSFCFCREVRLVLERLGIEFYHDTWTVILLVQHMGLGFILGAGFRLIVLRRQDVDHHDNAT